jgi:hypothetical protein
MISQKYIPRCCKGENAEYEGHVMINMPDYNERMDLIDECSVEDELSADMTDEQKKKFAKKNGTRLLRNIVARLSDFVTEVHIVRKEDEKLFDDLKGDMQYDSEMNNVMTELGTLLLGKYKVPKKELPL